VVPNSIYAINPVVNKDPAMLNLFAPAAFLTFAAPLLTAFPAGASFGTAFCATVLVIRIVEPSRAFGAFAIPLTALPRAPKPDMSMVSRENNQCIHLLFSGIFPL
jgi:hypothetical protein